MSSSDLHRQMLGLRIGIVKMWPRAERFLPSMTGCGDGGEKYRSAIPHCSRPLTYKEFLNNFHGIKITPSEDDDDDEFVMPEKPQFVMPSASDLAAMTPDPAYCEKHYPPEYHPQISKVYKKDCRTWLWKSAVHRSARLAEQEREKKQQEGMF